jgi:3-dehydro-L-gulonate 2-dehydrogenase
MLQVSGEIGYDTGRRCYPVETMGTRVSFDTMHAEFLKVLSTLGFPRDRAELCARLFAENSRDGVASHGLNRFPAFVAAVKEGRVDPQAEPTKVQSSGSYEVWDGQMGAGNLNAHACMGRAIELASQTGLGCVALRNTNHWMRGGSYGWQAAEAGCIGICWTNAFPTMPPWEAREPRLGNNPLVLAVPRRREPVVLDFALSVYSYGKLDSYHRKGAQLPFPGGFDRHGQLTSDPGEIIESKRALPIGYWKGSGLALLLDLVATLLSGGRSTAQIGQQGEEYAVSQVFLAFDVAMTPVGKAAERIVDQVIADFLAAAPASPSGRIRYPGAGTLATRRESLRQGIEVDPQYWQQVLQM